MAVRPSLKDYVIATDVAGGRVNPKQLEREIRASGAVQDFTGAPVSGGDISVQGRAILDEPLLDSTVFNHNAPALQDDKNAGNAAIDNHVQVRILRGFAYPAATRNIFALNGEAQIKLLGLFGTVQLPLAKNPITFPFTIATADNKTLVSLANAGEVEDMYQQMQDHIQTAVAEGNAAKATVNAATTQAQIDAAVAAFLAT